MISNLASKKIGIIFLLSLVSFSFNVYTQKEYSYKEISEYGIKPLNRENLIVFKKILLDNELTYGWTKYNAYYSYYMLKEQKRDSAIFYANKAITTYETVKDKYPKEEANLINAYFAKGRSYAENKDYQNSTIALLKCLEIEKRYPSKARGYIFTGIANNHLAIGNDSLALNFYKRALKDSFYISTPRSLITALTRVGALYDYDFLNEIDSAKYYTQKAIKRSIALDYKNNLSTLYGNLGSLYKRENKIDSTIIYYTKAHEILKQHKPITKEGALKTSLYDIANYSYVKIYSGKLDDAIIDLQSVLDSLSKFSEYNKDDKGLFLSVYENMTLAYQNKKDYVKSNAVLKKKEEFLNQFHKQQLKQELEKLQVQYETKKRKSEIQRLKILTADQKTIQKQRNIIFYSIIAMMLIFLIGIVFYFYQKKLNDKYKKVVLQQQLLRTQMNPHFIFNALNKIVILNEDQPDKVQNYVLGLSKLIRLTLENSREEYVPLEKEVGALEHYLILQSNFSTSFMYSIEMDPEIESEFYHIPPMIIQPFVENAIIHGIAEKKEKGIVKVIFETNTENTIICKVIDNGIGYSHQFKKNISSLKDHTSLSEKIVRERLAIYNKKFKSDASLEIKDLKDETNDCIGSVVKIVLPFYSI
ncbi:hypothetical protein ATO12_12765 [Aquimarina atlantica]|uniref:Signal transduction histidine kinase internal region domain-containing protein n=1 Tax=Aquimarina atlantica TaxID=1317122 RepID=A0A023BX29_9FLAO|nr:hypothetical protein ATO12_12765 [Aquimarina atlantica]